MAMVQYHQQVWNFRILDEKCPDCNVMKYHYNWMEDYFKCFFCGFKKAGEDFFSPSAYGGDDYCLECEDFIQESNPCEHDG